MADFAFDPSASDFDGNGGIQLSATGGQLAYLANRDAVGINAGGGVVNNATWRDEINAGDALRIDFASASIETVDIELKRLAAGESMTAEVRDAGGALLGLVTIPGQDGRTGSFTATIDQSDLDTAGAIASIELSRDNGSTNFSVGVITATEGGPPGNAAPVVDLDGPGGDLDFTAAIFTLGGAAVALADTDATVSDAEGDAIVSMTVTIANLADGAAEVLAVVVRSAGITVDASTPGTLLLTGPATPADFQQALRRLTYENTAASPTPGTRRIEITATDGSDSSALATAEVVVLEAGGGNTLVFDPEAGDFDGNAEILLSATGGQLAYLANRDAVGITTGGGIIADSTWRDEIGRNDELRIDFTSTSIETVEIELKRLGAGEVVMAEVRDAGGALLGVVNISGQGLGATSVFTAVIGQGDLDTPGDIASITLSRAVGGTIFAVGVIGVTEAAAGTTALAAPVVTDDTTLSIFGGETDLLGSDANDVLVGTPADEIIVGGRGDDTLLGNGGADSLQGGAGDDVIGIGDAGFLKVDGGGGLGDVLRLLDTGLDLDLTLIANNRIADIESIDMVGAGANTLTLDISDVLDFSTSTNTLTVLGDTSDAVAADFTGLGATSRSAGGFTTYTIGAGELVVDDDIDQTLIVL